jgi:hypothetical protein
LLLFDIVIFSLTLYKALTVGRSILLLNLIARDGASNQILPCTFNLNHPSPILAAMYFSYELFCLFADKDLDDSEQGTFHHQSREYFDSSGTP